MEWIECVPGAVKEVATPRPDLAPHRTGEGGGRRVGGARHGALVAGRGHAPGRRPDDPARLGRDQPLGLRPRRAETAATGGGPGGKVGQTAAVRLGQRGDDDICGKYIKYLLITYFWSKT